MDLKLNQILNLSQEEIDNSKEFAIRAIDGLVSKINSDILKINIIYK